MTPSRAMLVTLLTSVPISCSPGEQLTTASHQMSMDGPRLPGACEEPSGANQGKMGCYFDVALNLTQLPEQVFWHIDELPDDAGIDRPEHSNSIVVRAYGKVFRYTINGSASPSAKLHHLATIGPLPSPAGHSVTARFMQAMTGPGAMTRVHTHGGPEAFFLLSGAICMDSPIGPQTTGAGETYWIRGNVPMQLHHAGREVRRSIFLVLHPTSEPWMKMSDWKPTGGCQK